MSKLYLILFGACTALVTTVNVSTAQNATNAAKAAAPTNAPASVRTTNAPATARNIRFQFDGIPYTDVVERFAQMSGKPLVANTNIQGTLTYNDPRPYTFEEALDVLNVILSMKGLMLVQTDSYLQLIPFKDLPQMPLPILRGTDRTGDVRPSEVVTVVLDLKSLDAREIADSIVPMLSSAGSVAPLSRGRGLILTDRLQNIQRIKFLLAQIDTESSAQRQMKTFTLLHSSGAVVADLINRTFGIATAPKRTQYNQNSKQLDTLPPDPSDYVTAVYDDASRTLVLFGPPQRLELAEDLISRFEDKDGGQAGDVRIYFPQTIKADELATMIRQAVPGVAAPNETAATAATKARVIADAPQNRLIVAAPVGAQLDEIERLINKVDKPIHGSGGLTAQTKSQTIQITKVFRPRSTDVTAVAKILSEALSKRAPSGVVVPTANVSVEPGTQSVVVTGSPGDVQTAVDIVTQLETGSTMPVPQQTKFIEVGTVAEAKRLLPLVEQIYRSQVTDSLSGQVAHAKIIADAEAGRLIVTASDDHLKRIDSIVKQLRAEKPKQDARTLRIIALKNLRADAALASISGLVTERMAERRFEDVAKPSLVSDPVNNRLLVTATEDQFKEIEQVMKIVDVAPETAKREMAVLPVQSKPVGEMITLVSQLLTQLGDDQNNPQLAPKLLPDSSGKQIIALATTKDIERIRGLVQQLDTATTVAATRQFRGVDLYSRTSSELAPLVQQLYAEQLRGFPEPAGGAATVIAEAKNNRIMVSGPDKEITRVEAIIRQLDPAERKGAKEETRVIRLKTGVAGDLASLVEKSVNAQSQQVRVMVDARSNSLVVNGEPNAVDAAAQIIQQLDTRSDTGPREMRIIDLRSGDAATLAPMVTSLFTDMTKDQRGPDYVTQTKVVPDSGANRLIVSGAREDIAQIAKLVQQLDQTPEQSGSARVFKLQMASATTLAPIVSNAMVRFDARGQAVRKITVSADEKSNSLIITGGRTDVQDAAVIISRLDGETDGQFQEEARDLRIVNVNTSDPDQLAGLTMRVFAAQNLGRNITNILSITPEPSGKRLIVLAPRSMLAQVEQVVASLDQPADQAARELHSVDLKNSAAQEVFPTVSRIYSEQSAGKTIKAASIYPDASGTRLTVWGTKEQAASIRQIVDTLESQARPARSTKMFDLGKLADAQRLMPVAQQLYRDQFGTAPNGPADAQFITDGKTGRIIVSGRQDHLKAIDEIFARLQLGLGTNQTSRETRSFEIGTAADVQRILPLIQQLYQDQWKDKLDNDPADAQIVGDARAGKIIVSGKPEHIKQIELIIQQLGTSKARPPTEARETRIYDLTAANAVELATTVRTLYTEEAKIRLGTLPAETLILPDSSANRLIVSGDTSELTAIEQIIQKLDKVGAQSASTRVFKLKFAEPEKVMEILSNALLRYDASGRQQRRVSVSVDAKTRTIIATGDPKDLQGAAVIIEQLDASLGEQPERKMKVVSLASGRAADLAPKLRQLYADQMKSKSDLGTADALILEDTASNQFILAATDGQLNLLEQILSGLQSAQGAQTPRDSRIYDLTTASALELATTVRTLYQEQAKARPNANIAEALIMADASANRLIVSAATNELDVIEDIVKKLDKVSAQSASTRVFKLKSAEPDKVMEVLSTALVRYDASGRPQKRTSVVVDAKTRTLIATGDPKELQAASVIIEQIDALGVQAARHMKVVAVKAGRASEFAARLRQLYQDQAKGLPELSTADILILDDSVSNQLVLTGDDAQLGLLDRILNQLQEHASKQSPRESKTFDIGLAEEVTRLQTLVQQIYVDKWKDKAAADPADAQIVPDTKNGRLIVTGRPDHIQEIGTILASMTSSGTNATPAETRVYELTSSSASELATTVKTLYQEQIKTRPSVPAAQPVILPDVTANRLVVSAASNELAVIEEIVRKLDKADGHSGTARVFKLKVVEPAQVASMLSSALVKTDAYGRQMPRVSVGADERSSMVIVSGEAKDLQAAAVIIEQMDVAGAAEQRQMRIIPLTSGIASDVSTKLRQVYTDQLKGQGKTGAADALILGDDASNRLIITASKSHMELIEQIVKQFQEGGEGAGRQVRIITVAKQSASSVAAMISQLFARKMASSEAAQRLIVTASPDDRTLVVDGPGHTFTEVEQLVKTLDKAMEEAQSVLHTVQLKNAQSDDVAQAVQRAITGRGAQNVLQKVSVSSIDGANSLLINGPNEAVQEVLKIVHELDKESEDGEIKLRIYKLENGNVREVQGVLNQVLQGVTVAQRRRGGRGYSNLSVDERSNTLILSGSEAHFKVLEQLLKTLDKVPEKGERDVQFVWLKNARAVDVATKLDAVFAERPQAERPVIEADTFANSITLIGRRADVIQAQDLVSRLDETSKDSTIQVRLRPIDRLPAEQMARMLQNIYPQMASGRLKLVEKLAQPKPAAGTNTAPATNAPGAAAAAPPVPAEAAQQEVVIAVDKEANALILSGPANELDQIDRIVSELSFSFISNDAEFRLLPLKEADPIVVARTINQLFRVEPPPQPQQPQPQQPQQPQPQGREPRITVVAEPRTRSVIVRAKPADFTLVENLVKQLDGTQVSAQLEYRVVALTNAMPAKILPLVQEMVTQLRLVRPGDPLSVTVDARARGLLLVARAPLMDQVERMIRSLDTPSVYSEAEVLVVSLKKANATQLSAILQNMLKPGTQGEWTAEARELQEQIRRLKIQNESGQSVLLDLTKPIKIMSDPVASGQGGNRLLLTSTADNLKALAAVVQMMDTVALSEGVDVKIVRLERADADAVAQTLTSIFSQGQKLAAGPGGAVQPEGGSGKALVNPLNVALDARNNAVILSGRKDSLELAEKIINDLDKELERFITEVRLYQLKFASATKILPLLQAVFSEGPAVAGSAGLQTQVTRLRTALDGAQPKTTEQPKSRAALVVQADESANVIIAAARSDMLPLIEDVIKQLDVPAASGLSVVRLFPLKHADPQVIQKVINDLYAGVRATQVRSEDKPSVTIDDRTGTLIVASTERTFAIIESLLASLDKELAIDMRDIRILPLEHADANELAAQLQKLLDARVTQKGAMGRGQAEALRVLVIGEPRSNSLLIGGSKDSFELVQTLATQLDKAPSALSGKFRQVTLQYADARNIATALNQLFSQRYQAAKSPEVQRNKPVIVADARSNSLLIGAAVDDNQVIDELMLKLDKKLEDPALQLGVLALKHNDSGKVANTIENIFAARLQSRTPAGEQPSPQDRVKIETDALNNALIVSASRENLEVIQSLLLKLDVEPGVAGGVLTTFTLQFADAQRVATILRTLIDQGLYRPGTIVTAAAPGGKAAGGRDALAISVDPRSNTLIVSASPENLAVVRTVIAQIDTKDFAELGNVRLYSLRNARASSLATVLEQFFRSKQQGEATSVNAAERRVPVTIVPDERSNSLLVTGTKEGFDVIDRLLLQLDGEDARARLNFRVFALKQTTATKLQDTLRQLFVNRPPRVKGEPPEPISVVADSWVNALIVGASVDDMGMVGSLIERLDSDQGGPGLAVQVLPLAKADARKVAQTVQSLYREGGTGTASAQPVSVTADDRINAIVVSAGEGDVKRISELVKKLDTDQVARVAEIRVFALKYARAETLSTILNTSLNGKPTALTDANPNAQSVLQFIARSTDGKELVTSALKEGVLITPDSRVNSLIVSAPVDYMSLLEQIITKLDNSSHQKAKIKVFTLVNADARQTSEVLAGLFRLQPVLGTAAANPGQRSIQYTLVKTVGGPDSDSEAELASAILGTDEQTALNVTIDPRTNSLLIGGTEDYVSLVSQIIESLDSSEAQERKNHVYRLRNAQATEVATAIRTFLEQERSRVTQVLGAEAVGTAQRLLEREIAVVAEPISNTLLISASPRYFESITNLIHELDTPQPQVLIQVLVAEVSLDSALDLGLEWTYKGVPFAAGIDISESKWIATGFSSAVTGGDYSFLFRALEDKGRLEVLSRPQIVTADNKPAIINIGQTIPLITDSRVTERGDTINSFRYENVGVNLSVTPRIAPDGFVKMDVSTTNSTISSATVRVNANATVPIINQRIANTTVSVQSGQTILIGGLIGTLDDKRVSKVPGISNIPILGHLFRSNRNRQERRELLILLTPQVLTKSEAIARMLDAREMTDDQLRKSRIKDEIKRDEVQKQILDPVFPPDEKFDEKKPLQKPNPPAVENDESIL
jgi:type II secretion system protein D